MVDFVLNSDFVFNVYPNPSSGGIISLDVIGTNGDPVLFEIYLSLIHI